MNIYYPFFNTTIAICKKELSVEAHFHFAKGLIRFLVIMNLFIMAKSAKTCEWHSLCCHLWPWWKWLCVWMRLLQPRTKPLIHRQWTPASPNWTGLIERLKQDTGTALHVSGKVFPARSSLPTQRKGERKSLGHTIDTKEAGKYGRLKCVWLQSV